MSDEADVTNSEEAQVQEETTAPEAAPVAKPHPKPKPKVKAPVTKPEKKAVKPKKETKKAVKKPAKKVEKKAKKTVVKRPARDDARKVAKASGGKLTTDQVRILRTLVKGRSTPMSAIKTGCGIAEHQKYSGGFLKGFHALVEARYVRVEEHQDQRAHTHTITEKGKSVLQKAEASAKEAK